MTKIRRAGGMASVLSIAFALGACQSILPGDGPSRLALREKPVVASSGQRLGPDGYPLLGAFPISAAAQVDDATVQAERGGLQATASGMASTAAATSGEYRRQLTEAQAIRAAQRRDVEAALRPAAGAGSQPAVDQDAVLRKIEGLR